MDRTSKLYSFVCFFSDMAAPSTAHHKRVCHRCTHPPPWPSTSHLHHKQVIYDSFMCFHCCRCTHPPQMSIHFPPTPWTSHLWLVHVFSLPSPHKRVIMPVTHLCVSCHQWHHKQVIMTHLCVFFAVATHSATHPPQTSYYDSFVCFLPPPPLMAPRTSHYDSFVCVSAVATHTTTTNES